MDRRSRVFFNTILVVSSTYFVISLFFLLMLLNAGTVISAWTLKLVFLNLFASASICGYCVYRLLRP